MAIKRIKRINNLTIILNEDNPIAYQYQVKDPDGKILEGFSMLEKAIKFCEDMKDFCIRRNEDENN